VTAKFETELCTIPEIATVESTSATGISVISVELIRAADVKVQAGRLRGDETDLVRGITGEITSLDRLRVVELREDAAGQMTLLGDVAQVTRGPRLPLAEAALYQRQPSILVSGKLSEVLQVDRVVREGGSDRHRGTRP